MSFEDDMRAQARAGRESAISNLEGLIRSAEQIRDSHEDDVQTQAAQQLVDDLTARYESLKALNY